jgi:ABC-2 type transport system ATP-binding protein
MKQKLAVARAVFHRPPLVFLDEPTAGLDPVASAALREDLAALAAGQGVTIFLTTHNLVEAERLCDLVGVIRRGRLAALGAPSSLRPDQVSVVRITGAGLDEVATAATRLVPGVLEASMVEGALDIRLAEGAVVAPVVALLVERGVAIDEVRRNRQSLEEAFLELVTDDAQAPAPEGRA